MDSTSFSCNSTLDQNILNCTLQFLQAEQNIKKDKTPRLKIYSTWQAVVT